MMFGKYLLKNKIENILYNIFYSNEFTHNNFFYQIKNLKKSKFYTLKSMDIK